MPKYIEAHDASARTLKVYQEVNTKKVEHTQIAIQEVEEVEEEEEKEENDKEPVKERVLALAFAAL